MNLPRLLTLLAACTAASGAQLSRNNVPPDAVVATIEGVKMTAAELTEYVNSLPGQLPQFFDRDPKEFTKQLAMLLKLAKIAEAEQIDRQAPYKQRLEYARANVLMQSLIELRMNKTQIAEDDIEAAYRAQAPLYSQAVTKVLYVAFGQDGKPRSEQEAKERAAALRQQALAGADFIALIEKESDDAPTRQKKGDYPPFKRSDAIPDAIKDAIFALQPGQYTEPIRQAGGYYIFRLERLEQIPLSDVRNQIIGNIRQERFHQWFQEIRNSVDVRIDNEAFFQPGPGAAAAPSPSPGHPAIPSPPNP